MNANMRILIMVHNLTGGGAERVASLWATGFIQRGYEVGILLNERKGTPITYHIPESVRKFNMADHPWVSWIANKLYRRLQIEKYYVHRTRKVLVDFQPDVVIGVLQPYAEWARKASKNLNIKIINTEHNTFERPIDAMYNPMTSKRYRMKYEWNKLYDYVTVLTEADKRCVKNVLTNVSVLPNPLTYIPTENIPPKKKVILAAGRLDAWHAKGFDVLIKAWGSIANKYPNWRLQIAGGGNVKSKKFLQSIADECHLGKQIEFLGYQSDMLPIYRESSIFVLPSRYEGFGLVLIEAMSQGCASIACDFRGRQREIITNDGEGILYVSDSHHVLSEAIDKMIVDEAYRRIVQKNAIERSKFYSLNNIMDRWELILNKIQT